MQALNFIFAELQLDNYNSLSYSLVKMGMYINRRVFEHSEKQQIFTI